MKKILLLLLVPVLAVGALLGFQYYKLTKAADDLVAQAAPFAAITYDSVLMELDGSMGLSGVTVTPVGTNLPINIDKVYAKSNDPLFFFKVETPLDDGALPDSMSVHLDGLRLDLNSPVIKQYSGLMMMGAQQAGPMMTECDRVIMGSEDMLANMFGNELKLDMSFGYDFDAANENMNVSTHFLSEQNFDYSLALGMDIGTSQLHKKMMTMLNPQMTDMSLYYKDQGINSRMIGACAKTLNITPNEVRDAQAEQALQMMAMMGVEMGEAVTTAYKDMMKPLAEIEVDLDFKQATSMMMLAGVDPQSVMDSLDVQLRVNNKPIDTSGFSWNPEAMMAAQAQTIPMDQAPEMGGMSMEDNMPMNAPEAPAMGESADVSSVAGSSPGSTLTATDQAQSDLDMVLQEPELTYGSKPEAAEPESAQKYRVTPVAELNNYPGAKVKIQTQNGRLVEGSLLKVNRKSVQIRQELSGGVADLPVNLSLIKQVQVLR